jgi:membrane protein implicated in regulation of membrane protease activity
MDDDAFCLFVIFASVVTLALPELAVPEAGQVLVALFAGLLVVIHVRSRRSRTRQPERQGHGVTGR